jgi:sulfatase modifying factor 1
MKTVLIPEQPSARLEQLLPCPPSLDAVEAVSPVSVGTNDRPARDSRASIANGFGLRMVATSVTLTSLVLVRRLGRMVNRGLGRSGRVQLSSRLGSIGLAALCLVAGLGGAMPRVAEAQSAPAQRKQLAFLVGVNRPGGNSIRLRYAEMDVARLNEGLLANGFVSKLLLKTQEQAPRQPLNRSNVIRGLQTLLESEKPRLGDVLVLAIAGHGFETTDEKNGEPFPEVWLQVGPAATRESGKEDYLGLYDLLNCLAPYPGVSCLVLWDTCRDELSDKVDPPVYKEARLAEGIDPGQISVYFSCGSLAKAKASGVESNKANEKPESADEKQGHGLFLNELQQMLDPFVAPGCQDKLTWKLLEERVQKRFASAVQAPEKITPSSVRRPAGSKVLDTLALRDTTRETLTGGASPDQIEEASRRLGYRLRLPAIAPPATGAGAGLVSLEDEESCLRLKLVVVPAGDLAIKSPGVTRSNASPGKEPKAPTPFLVGVTEVTVGQFRCFKGFQTDAEREGKGWGYLPDEQRFDNDSRHGFNWRRTGFYQDDDHPVVNVTWNDAQKFVDWLNGKSNLTQLSARTLEGLGQDKQSIQLFFSLPTGDEWDYLCSLGDAAARDPPLHQRENTADSALRSYLPATIPPDAPSDEHPFTSPVGAFDKKSHPLGLADLYGNVSEWCIASLDGNSVDSSKAVAPPAAPSIRGGSWDQFLVDGSAQWGRKLSPRARSCSIGFRLVARIQPGLKPVNSLFTKPDSDQ